MAQRKKSAKSQIVGPREAREALGLRAGRKLLAVVRGNELLVIEKPVSHAKALRGIGAGLYPPGYLDRERDSWE